MSVKLHDIDAVVIGRFNPHIITPPWLVKEQIIADGQPVEAKIAIAGRTIAFQFATGEYTWNVDYNRLIVGTAKPNGNVAAIVAKVVEKLPHTPLTAFGNNFRYGCSLTNWKGRLPKLNEAGPDNLKTYGEVHEVAWKASFGYSDNLTVNVQLNLELTKPSPSVSVSFNFHRQVANAAALIDAANQFDDDRKRCEELLNSLLQEKAQS